MSVNAPFLARFAKPPLGKRQSPTQPLRRGTIVTKVARETTDR